MTRTDDRGSPSAPAAEGPHTRQRLPPVNLSPAFAFLQRRVSIDRHIGPLFGVPVWPFDADFDDLRRVAETDEHSRIVGRRVAAVGSGPAPERRAVRANDRRRARRRMSRRVSRPPQLARPDPVIAVADLVDSSRTGPLSFATTTSVSPSLSMSPNAAPRPTSGSWKTAPARSVTSSNRPLPRLRNSCLRCCSGNGSFALRQRLDRA